MDNLAVLREREKFEQENNMARSRCTADFVRNNVVARKIQKMFMIVVDGQGKDELEEFEKIYMILDKDLAFGKHPSDPISTNDTKSKVWEMKA